MEQRTPAVVQQRSAWRRFAGIQAPLFLCIPRRWGRNRPRRCVFPVAVPTGAASSKTQCFWPISVVRAPCRTAFAAECCGSFQPKGASVTKKDLISTVPGAFPVKSCGNIIRGYCCWGTTHREQDFAVSLLNTGHWWPCRGVTGHGSWFMGDMNNQYQAP